jgi:hypothetical protein
MTFFQHFKRKARTEHTCESCGRTIDPGETYTRQFAADDGMVWTYKECAHCTALVTLWALWEYAVDGYTTDTFTEYRDEIRTIADARLWALWKRRWRRRDGTLYPIPVRPATEAA